MQRVWVETIAMYVHKKVNCGGNDRLTWEGKIPPMIVRCFFFFSQCRQSANSKHKIMEHVLTAFKNSAETKKCEVTNKSRLFCRFIHPCY